MIISRPPIYVCSMKDAVTASPSQKQYSSLNTSKCEYGGYSHGVTALGVLLPTSFSHQVKIWFVPFCAGSCDLCRIGCAPLSMMAVWICEGSGCLEIVKRGSPALRVKPVKRDSLALIMIVRPSVSTYYVIRLEQNGLFFHLFWACPFAVLIIVYKADPCSMMADNEPIFISATWYAFFKV